MRPHQDLTSHHL